MWYEAIIIFILQVWCVSMICVAAFLFLSSWSTQDHFVDWFAERVHSSVEEDTDPMLEECLVATRKLLALFDSAVRQRGRHPIVRAAHASPEAFVNVRVCVCLSVCFCAVHPSVPGVINSTFSFCAKCVTSPHPTSTPSCLSLVQQKS